MQLNLNKKLVTKDLGDTAHINLSSGYLKIVFNRDIDVKRDLELQIIDDKNQKIAIKKHDGYVDFFGPPSDGLRFIATTRKTTDDNLLGKIYWVYPKNVKKDAPEFNFVGVDGNKYSNESLKGKIVVMNFWGISRLQGPHEISQLNKLVKQYEGRQDVVFLAVSDDPVDKLKDFNDNKDFEYRLVNCEDAIDLSVKMTNIRMFSLPTQIVLEKMETSCSNISEQILQ